MSPFGGFGGPEKDQNLLLGVLSSLTPDTTCKLYVLWHYSDTFSMDGTQIGIFKQPNQISFSCFLQSIYCTRRHSIIRSKTL